MSPYHAICLKHFPLAPISGDGPLALISLCDSVARISLFDLQSARQATSDLWSAHGCGAARCTGKHFQRNVRISTPVPAVNVAPRYCWEKDRD